MATEFAGYIDESENPELMAKMRGMRPPTPRKPDIVQEAPAIKHWKIEDSADIRKGYDHSLPDEDNKPEDLPENQTDAMEHKFGKPGERLIEVPDMQKGQKVIADPAQGAHSIKNPPEKKVTEAATGKPALGKGEGTDGVVSKAADEDISKAKPELGSGKRFKNLSHKLGDKGAKDPDALAAWIGRKKYGNKEMGKLSAGGKKMEKSVSDRLKKALGTLTLMLQKEMEADIQKQADKGTLGAGLGGLVGGAVGGPVGAAAGGAAGSAIGGSMDKSVEAGNELARKMVNPAKERAALRVRKAITLMTKDYPRITDADLVKAFGSINKIPKVFLKSVEGRPSVEWFARAIERASLFDKNPVDYACKLWYGQEYVSKATIKKQQGGLIGSGVGGLVGGAVGGPLGAGLGGAAGSAIGGSMGKAEKQVGQTLAEGAAKDPKGTLEGASKIVSHPKAHVGPFGADVQMSLEKALIQKAIEIIIHDKEEAAPATPPVEKQSDKGLIGAGIGGLAGGAVGGPLGAGLGGAAGQAVGSSMDKAADDEKAPPEDEDEDIPEEAPESEDNGEAEVPEDEDETAEPESDNGDTEAPETEDEDEVPGSDTEGDEEETPPVADELTDEKDEPPTTESADNDSAKAQPGKSDKPLEGEESPEDEGMPPPAGGGALGGAGAPPPMTPPMGGAGAPPPPAAGGMGAPPAPPAAAPGMQPPMSSEPSIPGMEQPFGAVSPEEVGMAVMSALSDLMEGAEKDDAAKRGFVEQLGKMFHKAVAEGLDSKVIKPNKKKTDFGGESDTKPSGSHLSTDDLKPSKTLKTS